MNRRTRFLRGSTALASFLLLGACGGPRDEVQPPATEEQRATDQIPIVTVEHTRDMRFCEVLVVKPTSIEVYNTTGSDDCPADKWESMDLEKIKEEYAAVAIQQNGPHYWMMDSQSLALGEKVTFNGIEARYAATLEPALAQEAEGSKPYTIFMPKKTQKMVYSMGKSVFELIDPDGHVYVLQARDHKFPIDSLATLGDKMEQLPAGWEYRTRVPTEDLVLDLTPDQTIYAVGDEFHQYYTRIQDTE